MTCLVMPIDLGQAVGKKINPQIARSKEIRKTWKISQENHLCALENRRSEKDYANWEPSE